MYKENQEGESASRSMIQTKESFKSCSPHFNTQLDLRKGVWLNTKL